MTQSETKVTVEVENTLKHFNVSEIVQIMPADPLAIMFKDGTIIQCSFIVLFEEDGFYA